MPAPAYKERRMLPLQRIDSLHDQIVTSLAAMPVINTPLPSRQQLHGDLADYWAWPNSQGLSRREQLAESRRAMLHAESALRVSDGTLSAEQAAAFSVLLDMPQAWQRHHQALERRAQIYRPVLSRSRPAWRAAIPGLFVMVLGQAEGRDLDPQHPTGPVLVFGLGQGLESYDSLQALHQELSERVDDPIQGRQLLQLLVEPDSLANARQADQVRYQWYADDPLLAQVDSLIEAQRLRLNQVWSSPSSDAAPSVEQLRRALQLADDAGSKTLLATRYAALLEKNLPNWMRSASPQALAHIMQGMQELVAAGERVAAPGILTLRQFQQQDTLQLWARQRVEARLRHDLVLDLTPGQIFVTVVHTRQTGPWIYPLQPSTYVTWRGFQKVGGQLIEAVAVRYSLDELARRNVAWFDYDYWLTARVSASDSRALPAGLTPAYIKAMVRSLNVGASYADYLRTQLLDTAAGQWRLRAHSVINRARMRAEAAKARYAGHLAQDWDERDYRWVEQVISQPHNALRPRIDGHPVIVRQLLIEQHTVLGVLLLSSGSPNTNAFVLYTPDAPDRRAWRSFASPRALLRLVRAKPALRTYLAQRLPLLPAEQVERWLVKGQLARRLQTPAIEDDLFHACYMAEVRSMLALADADSQTTAEADLHQAVTLSWTLLDLISIFLPIKVMVPLTLGRMVLEIWKGVDAYRHEDLNGVLTHAYNALSHANDAGTSLVSTGLVRRVLRGIPKPPPLLLPLRYSVKPDSSNLRYHINGLYGEQVHEKASAFEGLSQYYVQDSHGRYYKVTFDGSRWGAIDPDQPDAYLTQPVKRLANGDWVIDSPLLWYDGLPDLQLLLDSCRLPAPLQGTALSAADGLHDADGQLYLQTDAGQLPLRQHILAGRYHLPIPEADTAGVVPWEVLRWRDEQWRIQVRQAGRSSDWLALPAAYSVSLGSN